MGMTLYVKLRTPTQSSWFDDLSRAIKGAHCSSSTSCVGPNGCALSPDVTFSFSNDDKARVAEELASTFSFVESAEAKHPPARFEFGKCYVHRWSSDSDDYETTYKVVERSRSFVTVSREGAERQRLKINRDKAGNEYVRLGGGKSLLSGLWHLRADAVANG